jgi:hypothetical protein
MERPAHVVPLPMSWVLGPSALYRHSLAADRPTRYPAIFRTGDAGRAAHNASAVTPGSTTMDHSTSALTGHPIIASVIYLPNTVGGRVMCGPERAVGYNSSPVIGRSVCARGSDYRVPSTRRYVSRVAHGMIVGSLFRVMRFLVT